jgi:hypothetical protein
MMKFIGKLSYSLYLWQQLFFHYSFIPMFSPECDRYGRARKRVVLLVRKAFSKATLKLAQTSHPIPKRAMLLVCVVGNCVSDI